MATELFLNIVTTATNSTISVANLTVVDQLMAGAALEEAFQAKTSALKSAETTIESELSYETMEIKVTQKDANLIVLDL